MILAPGRYCPPSDATNGQLGSTPAGAPTSRISQFKNAAPGTRVAEIMPPRRPKTKPVRREGRRK